jgi:hypothetical protein
MSQLPARPWPIWTSWGCISMSSTVGCMLLMLGSLDQDQGRFKEALVNYVKAKAVLVQYKGRDYGLVLNNMAFCHKELQQWNKAVACYKEVVEHIPTWRAPAILTTQVH